MIKGSSKIFVVGAGLSKVPWLLVFEPGLLRRVEWELAGSGVQEWKCRSAGGVRSEEVKKCEESEEVK